MKTSNLLHHQLSAPALAWLEGKYRAVDAMSASDYGGFLADDCSLQFGNNPVAVGKTQLLQGIQHFWDSIGGLHHDFINIFGTDDHFAAEAVIDYTRKDNQIVKIPCVTTIQRNDQGLATSIKIFIDTTPIFKD